MHNFPRNADAYIAMLRDIQYHTDFVTASAELHSGPKLTQKSIEIDNILSTFQSSVGCTWWKSEGNRKLFLKDLVHC